MKDLPALLPLSFCLLLSYGAQAGPPNSQPCQPTRYNNAHSNFLHRHVRAGVPHTLDRNAWEKYLRDNKDCGRPTQSFLRKRDQDRVDAVCSGAGGRSYKGNLCISSRPFSFLTVRSEPGTCGVSSVRNETKHLILACDALENRCLPVHFEGNPRGLEPSDHAPLCRDTPTGRGARWTLTWTLTWIQVCAVLTVSRVLQGQPLF